MEITQAAEDYLKVIWNAGEWFDDPVTTKLLAERMGLSPSTVSEGIKRLVDRDLVEHQPYGAIELTQEGRLRAVAMVRRHRLIETFLVRTLGYTWDEVHDEAEVLEHSVSDRLIEALDSFLGHPERDPHGDPIPAADGTVPTPPAVQLADLEEGASAKVARISDDDPAILRYFTEVRIGLDTEVTVTARREYAGTIEISVHGSTVDLGIRAAAAIWVVPTPSE